MNTSNLKNEIPLCNAYDLNTYISPLWEGNTVVNESVMFMDSDEKITTDRPATAKKLLFPADEILCVYSADLKTQYVKGVDWDIHDGKLLRCEGSAMPQMTEDFFYPPNADNGAFRSTVEGHEFILFGESDTMIRWQVAVTYRHSAKWTGKLPTVQSEKFKNFLGKLQKGEEATIVFYGDSIITGVNSSDAIGIEPHAHSFPQMVCETLAEKYGYKLSIDVDPFNHNLSPEKLRGERVLHYVNTAVGGTNTAWGIENLPERVLKYKPDLMIFSFGMNDFYPDVKNYTADIAKLIGTVQENCPGAETLAIATMLPHYRVRGFYNNQYLYEDALLEMVSRSEIIDVSKVGVAEVTSAHKYLMERKEYYDMTGNNVNHPNDFLARLYGMVLLRTILGN